MESNKSIHVVVTTEMLERVAEIVMDNCEEVGAGRAESLAEQIIEFLVDQENAE